MLKIRLMYSEQEEADKAISKFESNFKVLSISKERPGKGKSLYRKIYIDLSNK
jgi:hypothetical protein